jgi:hypothetical protein
MNNLKYRLEGITFLIEIWNDRINDEKCDWYLVKGTASLHPDSSGLRLVKVLLTGYWVLVTR